MMTNPYAPPQAAVLDIAPPRGATEQAERLSRLGAAIIDVVIVAVMVYLPMFVAFAVAAASGFVETEPSNDILYAGVAFALLGGIACAWLNTLYVKRNGQSIGKKIVGIKVIRTDGSPISVGRIFWLRNVLNALLGILPLYGLIDVLFIFGESQQCLHDKIADTFVIKA
jgi:uncharacterized RDD family membrane protein YckC